MVKVLKENLSEYFKFNDDVVFGTISYGGCRCLEKKYSSSLKKKAKENGFYILGLCVKDGVGCDPTINVDRECGHEYIYVIGEYKNGRMYEIFTDNEIKYVDEVNAIQFKAPRNSVRFGNNIWQEFPVIGDEEFEPGYYFSDLCYVNCNKLDKNELVKYLSYFDDNMDIFIKKYSEKLDLVKKYTIREYNKICDAYNFEKNNVNEEHINKVRSKIIAHKYGIK